MLTDSPLTILEAEASHRDHAIVEQVIADLKQGPLAHAPLHGFAQNALWCHLVLMAAELTAWTQLLAFADHPARRWEPERLPHRIFTIPATLASTGRRVRLHLKQDAPWADLALTGWTRLAALAPP